MHIIWKRPDGFQNAQPEDFRRIQLSNGAHLWVHRTEMDWYPFQVSGDWKGQHLTNRLNRLVNLLDSSAPEWDNFLEHYQDDDVKESSLSATAGHLLHWITELEGAIKGETWEADIMCCALRDIADRLRSIAALAR
jgi:hypothetical protein